MGMPDVAIETFLLFFEVLLNGFVTQLPFVLFFSREATVKRTPSGPCVHFFPSFSMSKMYTISYPIVPIPNFKLDTFQREDFIIDLR